MSKIVVASDSHKRVMNGYAVSRCLARGLSSRFREEEICVLKISDGGEGLLDVFAEELGGEILSRRVRNTEFELTSAKMCIYENEGKTAIIEVAEASGIRHIRPGKLNLMDRTSYGTGQLMKAALDAGCSRIVVGLGGSGIADMGIGALHALGGRFLTREKEEVMVGKDQGYHARSLECIESVDLNGVDTRLFETEIILASDVMNPLLGTSGSARVFGPQKGGTVEEIEVLEASFHRYADLLKKQFGKDVDVEYCGAAGGFAASFLIFPRSRLVSGIDFVLDAIDFDGIIEDAVCVITGEGRLDETTLYGKAPFEIVKRARHKNIPVVGVFGIVHSGRIADQMNMDRVLELSMLAPSAIDVHDEEFKNRVLPEILHRAGEKIAEEMIP